MLSPFKMLPLDLCPRQGVLSLCGALFAPALSTGHQLHSMEVPAGLPPEREAAIRRKVS